MSMLPLKSVPSTSTTRFALRGPSTLALGVYASSWSFNGSVGFAKLEGYRFLAIYLGVTLACALTPVIWQRVLSLTREYQLTSLADLFDRFDSQRSA